MNSSDTSLLLIQHADYHIFEKPELNDQNEQAGKISKSPNYFIFKIREIK